MPTVTATRGRIEAQPAGPNRLRPFPALDGIRGLAVAAVVLFHYPTHRWIPGGLFGVDVFFVLSGFLVTAGLLDEWSDHGSVKVRRFLARRAWRLVPGLVALLAVFLVLASFFRDSRWFSSTPFGSLNGPPLAMHVALSGVAAALLYSYNILLARGWATPSSLGHLWTLAIEGQFYVGWVLAMRWVLRRQARTLLPIVFTIAAASACSPWFMWHGGSGANAIYFGTLPRLQQLFAGAALALLWRDHWLERLPKRVLQLGAMAGAGTLIGMCLTVTNVKFKYLCAETATAVATAALVVHLLTNEQSGSARLLRMPVLTWLGRRSYGIYLWHWPLAEWTNRFPHSWGVPLGIGMSLLVAELSWRVVERPAQVWSRRRASTPNVTSPAAVARS